MSDFTSLLDQASAHLTAHDPIIKQLVAQFGPCQITPHHNYYQELVDAIISQQLSVKAARTIEQRFCALFGANAAFPSPEQITRVPTEQLREAGLSRSKAAYIQDLAQHVLDGRLKFDEFTTLSNDQIVEELVAVKGIGVWTAHMFLIFSLGRLDILPVGDLGIKNGIKQLYKLDNPPTADDIQNIAKEYQWHPYESVACWYIWESLDNAPTISS